MVTESDGLRNNRWVIAVAGFLVMFALGSVYAWSVFVGPLQEQFGWSRTEATLPYMALHAVIFIGTFTGGWIQDRIGPRPVALAGVLAYGTGVSLASLVNSSNELWLLIASYGLLGGLGLGFAYIVPPSMLSKWFPDRRGLANGLAVGGYGAGALATAPIGEWLINFFGSVPPAFLILGVSYLTLGGLSALLFRDPPRSTDIDTSETDSGETHFSLRESLRTWQWFALTVMLTLNVIIGNALLSQASPVAQELGNVTATTAAGLVGALGLFNAGGRLFWASLSDSIGRLRVFLIMFLLQVVLFVLLPQIGIFLLLGLFIGLIVSCYGGGFSIMPALAADFYGTKNAGAIYGAMIIAWSIGGVVGPYAMSELARITGGFETALYIFAGLALITVVLPIAIGKPKQRRTD